jgi:hypothetical protein
LIPGPGSGHRVTFRGLSRTDREDDHGEEGKVEDQEVEEGESQEGEKDEENGCGRQEETRSSQEERCQEAGQESKGEAEGEQAGQEGRPEGRPEGRRETGDARSARAQACRA